MAYFSLLYRTKQQEDRMKSGAGQQLFIRERKATERRFQLVGNKMVAVTEEETDSEAKKLPCYFTDLGIDQIVSKILQGDTKEEAAVLFTELIKDSSLITYRQDIFRDLDHPQIKEIITDFQSSMLEVIRLKDYATQSKHPVQKSKYLLDAMELYQDSLIELTQGLAGYPLSEGLSRMQLLVNHICQDTAFIQTKKQAEQLKQSIEAIHYSLTIQSGRIKISIHKKEGDYREELHQLFQRNASDTASALNQISFFRQIGMNDLELAIFNILEKRYHPLFQESMKFTAGLREFPDPEVVRIHKELRFYLACHDYIGRFREKGLSFTYPEINEDHTLELAGLYDINLALKSEVISNDFALQEREHGAWITGANQGGKTTFVRSVGQSIYLALIGLPVPASYARIPLYDNILTHFSTEEDAIKSNGKLKEELLHLKELIGSALGGKYLFLLNELFSSATSSDAFEMSRLLVQQLIQSQHTVLCVTHIPRLAKEVDGMVSIGTQMNPSHTHERTYRLVRKEAELTAYADDIARKYELTFDGIKERLGHED